MALILVGGGSRSGKSEYARRLALQYGSRRAFLATAQPFDAEMRHRIALHQQERGADFVTIEEPLAVAAVLRQRAAEFDVVVVDCLTLWLTNVMLSGASLNVHQHLEQLAALDTVCICVTNEVGCGIVPDNALAREFRDRAGWLNQHAAALAREVYFMAFGLALRMK